MPAFTARNPSRHIRRAPSSSLQALGLPCLSVLRFSEYCLSRLHCDLIEKAVVQRHLLDVLGLDLASLVAVLYNKMSPLVLCPLYNHANPAVSSYLIPVDEPVASWLRAGSERVRAGFWSTLSWIASVATGLSVRVLPNCLQSLFGKPFGFGGGQSFRSAVGAGAEPT